MAALLRPSRPISIVGAAVLLLLLAISPALAGRSTFSRHATDSTVRRVDVLERTAGDFCPTCVATKTACVGNVACAAKMVLLKNHIKNNLAGDVQQ